MHSQSEGGVTALLLASLMAPALGQEPVTWRDPSQHQVQFVTVEDGVRLEARLGRIGTDRLCSRRGWAIRPRLRRLRPQADRFLSRLQHHAA